MRRAFTVLILAAAMSTIPVAAQNAGSAWDVTFRGLIEREEHRRVHAPDGRASASSRLAVRQAERRMDPRALQGMGMGRAHRVLRRPVPDAEGARRSSCSAPTPFKASLEEPAVAVDPTSSQKAEQLPSFNAYSVDGDVTGPLVYVNYGRPSDYEELARRGISVKGAIVIARYGAVVARHQAQGRRRARRDRLPDLLRSRGRRVLRGRRVSGRPDAERGRRAARQRDGHADVSRAIR